mmetsp:Transcript_22393/g.88640  ORF Transcript_22393/g.88640 Transcript_22393/m.88640 type:complete len:287 (-) Transcript_22393:360-1220(-)
MVAAARVIGAVDRGRQRDEAEVEQRQQQRRREPGIPHPPGAPGGPAPQRTGDEGEHREQRAGGRQRAHQHKGQPCAPGQAPQRPEGHRAIADHRDPGGRHMQVEDAVGLALLGVGRRDEQAQREARGEAQRGQRPQRRQQPAAERQEVGGAGIAPQTVGRAHRSAINPASVTRWPRYPRAPGPAAPPARHRAAAGRCRPGCHPARPCCRTPAPAPAAAAAARPAARRRPGRAAPGPHPGRRAASARACRATGSAPAARHRPRRRPGPTAAPAAPAAGRSSPSAPRA